jgi:hypothetical protein
MTPEDVMEQMELVEESKDHGELKCHLYIPSKRLPYRILLSSQIDMFGDPMGYRWQYDSPEGRLQLNPVRDAGKTRLARDQALREVAEAIWKEQNLLE